MSHNPHKNIITVLQCGCLTPPWYYIDMELCEYNLDAWIHRVNGGLNNSSAGESRVSKIWEVMLDIIRGVMYIHSQKQVHRDLKPRNGSFPFSIVPDGIVLYSRQDHTWKLTDFGLTMDGSSQVGHVTRYSRGSECYRAPEILFGNQYTNTVDIWAIGCVLFELVFGAKAFLNDFAVSRYADSGQDFPVPPIPDDVSDESKRQFLTGVIRELLQIDGSRRPSARSLFDRFVTWELRESAGEDIDLAAVTTSTEASSDTSLPDLGVQTFPQSRPLRSGNLESQLSSLHLAPQTVISPLVDQAPPARTELPTSPTIDPQFLRVPITNTLLTHIRTIDVGPAQAVHEVRSTRPLALLITLSGLRRFRQSKLFPIRSPSNSNVS